jgi:Leucine-rich repeat (LRR) protein
MLKILIALFVVDICCFYSSIAHAQDDDVAKDYKIKFLDYCRNTALNEDESYTLISLKERYKINSCGKLYEKLNRLEFISIRDKGIKDVSIFKYFSNLKRLGLDKNKIDDLSVFENFDKITYLSLQDNNISDVRPLLKMKSLKKISLDRNPVEKQSKYCPVATLNIDINEFCFDLKKFDADFRKGKNKLRIPTKDIRGIIKNVIDYPRLQMYYHVKEVPTRSPLQVYFNFDVPTEKLALEKFNKKILIVKEPNKLALKIKIVVRGDLALVKFIYSPEGIRGNFRMSKANETWTILKSHIYE